MNYLRNWVLAAYRAEHEARRDPSQQILAKFDRALFDDYEQELLNHADATIPLTPFNKSILVYFATRSQASNASTRVRHAYEFFRNTRPTP